MIIPDRKLMQSSFIKGILIIVLSMSTIAVAGAECEKPFSLGWEPWAPYQFLDDKKQLTGLDIELVTAIVKKIGCNITHKNVQWKRHLKELEQGRIDLASGASKTPEREVYAFFSDAYRNEYISLYVRKGESNKYDVKSLKDILKTPFILGVTRGYYYGEEFANLLKNPQFIRRLQYVKNDEQHYDKLVKNRIDGFLPDHFTAQDKIKEKDLIGKIERHPMPIILTGDIFVMLSKKSLSPAIVKDFNNGLNQIKDDGTYRKILDKYLKNNN